jgi:thiol-disulfide isomerase/thioredoxin
MKSQSFSATSIQLLTAALLSLALVAVAQAAPKDDPLQIRLEAKQGAMGSLVNYYRPIRCQLGAKPKETLKAEPKYQSKKPLYGVLKAGNGVDSLITVVVDEIDAKQSRIYIDRNNDEDLTNDGKSYAIGLLDDNADGRFDDLDNGALIIDLNQDGKLQGRSDSAEYHKLGQPFNVHGTTLEIASLSPHGLNLTLRHSKAKVAMKSFIAAGHPAPQFTAKDLQGNTIDLQAQAKESKYILLDFWASWCGPCKKEYPYLRRLHAQYQNHGLRIIGVNLDTKLEKAIEAANDEILDYAHVFDGKGWKNEIAQLYRVRGIPATFLLD